MTLNIAQNFLPAFCWMLIHSLWIGLILCILTSVVMFATRKSSSSKRYNGIAILFIAYVFSCIGIFVFELVNTTPSLPSAADEGFSYFKTPSRILHFFSLVCEKYSSWISTCWFVLFILKCLRLYASVSYIHRLQRAEQFLVYGKWKVKFDELARSLHVERAVRLVESGIATVPVVVGYVKPVIYMPLGLLMNLPAEQVEAVLLHELAHIKRNDYAFNLFQNVVEAIFFFNPALLWVSSILKEEREYCCDDIALQSGRPKRLLIEALVSFKEHSGSQNRYALAFAGRRDSLLKRVTRMVKNTNQTLNPKEKVFFVASILMIGFLAIAVKQEKQQSPTVFVQAMDTITTSAFEKPIPSARKGNGLVEFENRTEASVTVEREETQKNNTELPDANTRDESFQTQDNTSASDDRSVENTLPDADRSEPATLQPDLESERREAEIAREQARIRREIADQNRLEAERDREHANRLRHEADIARQRADLDRAKADAQRAVADKEREQADQQRRLADQQREQAEIDRGRVERDRESRASNKQQSPTYKAVYGY